MTDDQLIREDAIMKDAERARVHDRTLAEIKARMQSDTERQITSRRESRNEMLAWMGGIAGVTAVILTIIISISNATSEDRVKELKLREQQKSIAETCIRAGNIWVDNNCIIGGRTSSQ